MVIFHSYVKLPGGKVRCKHVDLFEPRQPCPYVIFTSASTPLDLHSHSWLDVSSSMMIIARVGYNSAAFLRFMIMTYLDKSHHNLTATSLEQWLMRKVIRNGLNVYPIGSMYAIYGNIYHQYTPNVSIYTIHGSYGYRWLNYAEICESVSCSCHTDRHWWLTCHFTIFTQRNICSLSPFLLWFYLHV